MKLCYVRYNTCYFTKDFDNVWGDDWDDIPYEHNAGEPYEKYGIFELELLGPAVEPFEGYDNSPYSVEQINKGVVPWIRFVGGSIYAGTELHDFLDKVLGAGFQIMDCKTYGKLIR